MFPRDIILAINKYIVNSFALLLIVKEVILWEV